MTDTASGPQQPPDLCEDCDAGEHSTCDFTLRREAGRCGCLSSRHEWEPLATGRQQ